MRNESRETKKVKTLKCREKRQKERMTLLSLNATIFLALKRDKNFRNANYHLVIPIFPPINLNIFLKNSKITDYK
jgi:hypothetical protein